MELIFVLLTLETFRIFIAKNADTLQGLRPHATVEAEYGDEVVEGRLATLAHHGSRSDNPPPCMDDSVPTIPEHSIVGISHLDLDTIGGLLRLAGYKIGNAIEEAFWKIAGRVDVSGPHKLKEIVGEEVYRHKLPYKFRTNFVDMFNAYYAWSRENRLFAPKNGDELCCTNQVVNTVRIICKILAEDEALLKAGREFAKEEYELNKSSYVRDFISKQGLYVCVRRSDAFVNHLYTTPAGRKCDIVVTFRGDFGAITVSRESDSVPVDCREVVKAAFGPKANGQPRIAGSPRGQKMTNEDFDNLCDLVLAGEWGPVNQCPSCQWEVRESQLYRAGCTKNPECPGGPGTYRDTADVATEYCLRLGRKALLSGTFIISDRDIERFQEDPSYPFGGCGFTADSFEEWTSRVSGKWWYNWNETQEVHPKRYKESRHNPGAVHVETARIAKIHGPNGEELYSLTEYYHWTNSHSAPKDADICGYCGYNNMYNGKSYRQGWDCGRCGGN